LASAKKVIPANASEISTASNRCTKFEDKLLETWGHVVLDNNIDSVVD
jgi:hypothetical protein